MTCVTQALLVNNQNQAVYQLLWLRLSWLNRP